MNKFVKNKKQNKIKYSFKKHLINIILKIIMMILYKTLIKTVNVLKEISQA